MIGSDRGFDPFIESDHSTLGRREEGDLRIKKKPQGINLGLRQRKSYLPFYENKLPNLIAMNRAGG